jgi:hypothetical protein
VKLLERRGIFFDYGNSAGLPERRQHGFRAGVVAEGLADVDEQVLISRSEDEASAQLKRIFSQPMLLVSGGLRTPAALHVVAAEQVQQRSVFEPHGFVSFAIFVDQQREVNLGFLAEEGSILFVAQPDRGQPRAFLPELFFVFAQLRDVLAAEDSAVMPQKNDRGRTLSPKRSQAHAVAVDIRQGNARKLAAEGFSHGGHSPG